MFYAAILCIAVQTSTEIVVVMKLLKYKHSLDAAYHGNLSDLLYMT